MKSILLESSSVQGAIDKAWQQAGKPKEFTIKVHDFGEKTYFGFTSRPAAVSLVYNPGASNGNRSRSGKRRNNSNRRDRSSDNRNQQRDSAPKTFDVGQETEKRVTKANEWVNEWVSFIVKELRALLELSSITTDFEATKNRKMLTISFKDAVLADSEEQRMLFASLSYLLIQLLKRHYKNRFVGFKIIVTCASQPKPPKKQKEQQKEAKPSKNQTKVGEVLTPSDHSVSDQIENEQIKFAQAQLEQERSAQSDKSVDE